MNQPDKLSDAATTQISAETFAEIEVEGRKLSKEFRLEIGYALESFVRRYRWDRESRRSDTQKQLVAEFKKHADGLLRSLEDLGTKFRGDGDFDFGVALLTQSILWRAKIDPMAFAQQLRSISEILPEYSRGEPGAPPNFYLPQFLIELEDIFIRAGGFPNYTKDVYNYKYKSRFGDFAYAVLSYAPPDVDYPNSSEAVTVAWGRIRPPREKLIPNRPGG